ncbi:A24 family peptidase [Cellulomonas sp. KRMCY2]|uniref:prepilin peptidase n=1 Tax=Cellulomonas sp. KRMCY2 TaxID=1304865 RepID=UPI00045EAA36|nr:A24 family peptidase [Cellulomonas sp. KRMCY2]
MTDAFLGVLLVGVLGLAVGSFLNVVIWRVPRGESVVSPASACPRCAHTIRHRDNIPVLSWLLLRGRCRDCAEPISPRYPLVEAGTAVLFALVAVRFLVDDALPWALPAYLYLGALAVALALIDLDVHRLPDALVLPAYPVLAALLAVASWGSGQTPGGGSLLRAVLGGAALLAFYGGAWFIHPRGMGLGDVKLAGVLGAGLAWLGWGTFAVGAFAAFVAGGFYAIGLLTTGRAGRTTGIPFGPWMLLGAGLGVAAGEPLWSAYLDLLM